MWRTLQFLPAAQEKMLLKANLCEADAIIFDLEDSIALEDKAGARTRLRGFLEGFQNPKGCGLVVRINPLDGLGDEDLRALSALKQIDAFLLPKADAEGVGQLDQLLWALEKEEGFPEGTFGIIALIESAGAVWNALAIAGASPRLQGMLFGAEDFTADMGIQRTPGGEEIAVARSLHAMAAKAAGIEAYDTPYPHVRDPEGLLRDTLQGKQTGMTGKAAIHPAQVSIINEAYSPTPEEVEYAKRILMAEKAALAEGKGVFALDGKMVDLPVIQRAKTVLALHEIMGNPR